MDKKITIDEWLEIAVDVIGEAANRFSDDGKISLADGLALLVTLLKAVAKAYKEQN